MDIPTHLELVEQIDAFLARHPKLAPSRLGRDATGEPNLIKSIRAGRSPNLDTLNKLSRFMAEHDAKEASAAAGRPFSLASSPGRPAERPLPTWLEGRDADAR